MKKETTTYYKHKTVGSLVHLNPNIIIETAKAAK